MKIKVLSYVELLSAFKVYGKPNEVRSEKGNYTPYETDTENDLFDECMHLLATEQAEYIELNYFDEGSDKFGS